MKTRSVKCFLFLILLSFNLKAADSFEADATDYVENFNNVLLDINLNGVEVSDNCATFMNEGMVLGSLGKFIYNEVKTNGKVRYPNLINATSFKNMCPRYAQMDNSGKAKIITLLLATMAHFESTCNTKAKNHLGPNGTAIGLYQLHKNKEDSYDGQAQYCLKNSGYKSAQASICALSMLNLQIKNRGSLFSAKSYWDILRPAGHASKTSRAPQLIKKAILNMQSCR